MTTADDVFENTYGQVGDTTSVDALRTNTQPPAVDPEDLAAKIKDAYYHARDNGGTMHTAADDAVRSIIDSGVLRDATAVRRDFAAWCLESDNAVGRLKDTVAGYTPAPEG